ncbi:metal-dependent hydrolase [Halorussus sp. MSC15.2]|uniref:metal-dependent hydrolase n=1 Tax=Halorussus sp. MSC15.2 TaxID=2283638 RepID=UPI0013D14C52|nr:metal-dependent hydrolase [Halorussus sp. MSC15.2]NEU58080.1 metal-dependent hydrolase [Halorussus sp. MSC15.2]
MWPWGHLAVGYLLYTAFVHLWHRRAPDGPPTVALAFGTQFPDLVDKPLAWTLDVLPTGRSLTHSLLTAVVLVIVLELLLRRRDHGTVATAFAVGYGSHLFGDALYPVLDGTFSSLRFLVWPLLPPIEYSTGQSFIAHLDQLSLDSLVVFEVVFGVCVFALWLLDGAPGLRVLAAIPRWVGRKITV